MYEKFSLLYREYLRDFQQNLARLHQYPTVQIQYIQQENHIYPIREEAVVIDALYGSGLNRKLEGLLS